MTHEAITTIKAPTINHRFGERVFAGTVSREQAIEAMRKHAAEMRAAADAIDSTADDDFAVQRRPLIKGQR